MSETSSTPPDGQIISHCYIVDVARPGGRIIPHDYYVVLPKSATAPATIAPLKASLLDAGAADLTESKAVAVRVTGTNPAEVLAALSAAGYGSGNMETLSFVVADLFGGDLTTNADQGPGDAISHDPGRETMRD
jgi:hypothetical protein